MEPLQREDERPIRVREHPGELNVLEANEASRDRFGSIRMLDAGERLDTELSRQAEGDLSPNTEARDVRFVRQLHLEHVAVHPAGVLAVPTICGDKYRPELQLSADLDRIRRH